MGVNPGLSRFRVDENGNRIRIKKDGSDWKKGKVMLQLKGFKFAQKGFKSADNPYSKYDRIRSFDLLFELSVVAFLNFRKVELQYLKKKSRISVEGRRVLYGHYLFFREGLTDGVAVFKLIRRCSMYVAAIKDAHLSLINEGLVEEVTRPLRRGVGGDGNGRLYRITTKGLMYMERFKEVFYMSAVEVMRPKHTGKKKYLPNNLDL